MKKYYIYAGYYELWISDVKLGRPLTYIGWCKSLENAEERCRRYDDYATICYSESLKSEVKKYFAWIDWSEENVDETLPFFNEQEYKLSA